MTGEVYVSKRATQSGRIGCRTSPPHRLTDLDREEEYWRTVPCHTLKVEDGANTIELYHGEQPHYPGKGEGRVNHP